MEALYHREQSRYRAVLRSALPRDEQERVGIPDVVGAWQQEAGGSGLFTVVAIRQRYPGHARQALHVAAQCRAGAYAGRYTIVVDEDIDPSNLEDVVWAVCTRSDPATSIDLIHRSWSTLDPRIPPDRKAARDFTNSRALIDATRPWEWRDRFPAIYAPPREQRQGALRRWGYLLEK